MFFAQNKLYFINIRFCLLLAAKFFSSKILVLYFIIITAYCLSINVKYIVIMIMHANLFICD